MSAIHREQESTIMVVLHLCTLQSSLFCYIHQTKFFLSVLKTWNRVPVSLLLIQHELTGNLCYSPVLISGLPKIYKPSLKILLLGLLGWKQRGSLFWNVANNLCQQRLGQDRNQGAQYSHPVPSKQSKVDRIRDGICVQSRVQIIRCHHNNETRSEVKPEVKMYFFFQRFIRYHHCNNYNYCCTSLKWCQCCAR